MRVEDLSKKYNKMFAVSQVNMYVEQNDIYGLIGRNGAGKTTLLSMISGLVIPASGKIKRTLMIYDRHPELQSKWNKAFWARGCCVATVGNITEDVIKK